MIRIQVQIDNESGFCNGMISDKEELGPDWSPTEEGFTFVSSEPLLGWANWETVEVWEKEAEWVWQEEPEKLMFFCRKE